MDPTTLFVFPRYCDCGRLTTLGDVRVAAFDFANVQRLVEATPDDVAGELIFIARRLASDTAFAVRYESLVMTFVEGSPFRTWSLLHPGMSRIERERRRLRYQQNVFNLYMRLQEYLCPDSIDPMNTPSEEAQP